jgi:hypothetical protein
MFVVTFWVENLLASVSVPQFVWTCSVRSHAFGLLWQRQRMANVPNLYRRRFLAGQTRFPSFR